MKRSPLKRKTPLRSKMPQVKEKRAKGRMVRVAGKKPAQRNSTRSMAWYKKELDRVFSLYIRAKFPPRCYTCGKVGVSLQCGHFISRQYLATRWDENNCRPQCIGDNIFGNGKTFDFEEALKKEIGNDVVEQLKKKRHEIWKLDRAWYVAEIERYKNML